MARADDAPTTDWIWLREAQELAAKRLGSKAGAEKRLQEWLATDDRKLPWIAEVWEAPTEADIAKWNQMLGVVAPTPYYNGEPRFMAVAEINWEDSSAREASYLPDGAQAWGIRVSPTHLVALLPTEAREREETPEPIKPAERELMVPARWLAWARKEYPKQQNEGPSAHILRLHGLMQKADNVTEVWTFGDFRRRYYE
jgi:hypothetical protein